MPRLFYTGDTADWGKWGEEKRSLIKKDALLHKEHLRCENCGEEFEEDDAVYQYSYTKKSGEYEGVMACPDCFETDTIRIHSNANQQNTKEIREPIEIPSFKRYKEETKKE
jgi:hypothetical protein